ncbi:hypothetical protein [Mesorhizobium silamurunense]|uniref:hypothetical protein n=1 Tax=Mesorhizobium silamurunense TaxID=499528 RepID=UPI00177F5D8B|nr:hypothetical protein [Mesorhizobium silamurunense]
MGPIYFQTDLSSGRDDWHAIDYLEAPSVAVAALTSARFPIISHQDITLNEALLNMVGHGLKTKNSLEGNIAMSMAGILTTPGFQHFLSYIVR